MPRSMPIHTIKSYHFLNSFARCRPVVVLKEGKAAAAASMASCVSAASNSGAVLIALPEDGSKSAHSYGNRNVLQGLGAPTLHFKGLSRLCLHPFPIDICHIGLEQSRVVKPGDDVRHRGGVSQIQTGQCWRFEPRPADYSWCRGRESEDGIHDGRHEQGAANGGVPPSGISGLAVRVEGVEPAGGGVGDEADVMREVDA